jgi:hypothetical protein
MILAGRFAKPEDVERFRAEAKAARLAEHVVPKGEPVERLIAHVQSTFPAFEPQRLYAP